MENRNLFDFSSKVMDYKSSMTGLIFSEPNRRFIDQTNAEAFSQFLAKTVFPPPYAFSFTQRRPGWQQGACFEVTQTPFMNDGYRGTRFYNNVCLHASLVRLAQVPVELRTLVSSFLIWKHIPGQTYKSIWIGSNDARGTVMNFTGQGTFFTYRERRLFIAAYMKFCGLKRLEGRFLDADRILQELERL